MKVARFVLKVVAMSLSIAAAVCCVIAFWDKIEAFFSATKEKIAAGRACHCASEYDDYADWDD